MSASFMRRSLSAHPMSVVDQVVRACSPESRLATQLGFVLGGVVPVATYVEAHFDLDAAQPLYAQPATFLVAGGLVFSAKTVFSWAQLAFRDGWKALGFVVLLEGVMITSHVPVLPLVLLAILVAINGVATGCTLSLDRGSRRAPIALAPVLAVVQSPDAQRAPASGSSNARPSDGGELVVVSRRTRKQRTVQSPQECLAFGSNAG